MKNRGFTLIELMITIAILAIIVAIAVPAYQNQIQKTRRADAQSALMSAAQSLERCFTRFNSYNADKCPDIPPESPDGFYTIDPSNINSDTFELIATPKAGTSQYGDPCVFKLSHLGKKTPAPGSDDNRCWGS